MNKRKVKLIIAAVFSVVFAILLVYKICYWVTLHPTGTHSGVTYFDESDGYVVAEQPVNEKTGLIEKIGSRFETNHCMRGVTMTVKGNITSGYLHYEIYDDNGHTAFKADFQPGEYDEEYYIDYLGYYCEEYACYPPDTKGLIEIDIYPQATGFDLDGFKKQPPME